MGCLDCENVFGFFFGQNLGLSLCLLIVGPVLVQRCIGIVRANHGISCNKRFFFLPEMWKGLASCSYYLLFLFNNKMMF